MSKKNTSKGIAIAGAAGLLLAVTLTVSAAMRNGDSPNKNNAGATSTQESKIRNLGVKQIERVQNQSDKLIENHINALTRLSDRVQTMKKTAEQEKTAILNQIQTNITQLNELKNATSTSTAAATAASKTISKAYRSYALVAPRGYIIASADRINSLAVKMQGLGVKLTLKIAEAKTAGNDIAALEKMAADMNSKTAEAVKLAGEAKALVVALVADEGDAAKAAQNRAAIISAREKIKTAASELNSARLAANNIAKEIRKMGIKTNVGFGNTVKPNPTSTSAAATNATSSAAATTTAATTTY